MKRFLVVGTVGVAALVVGITIAVAAGGGESAKASNATVSVKTIGSAGKVLVDSKGRALYVNDQDRGGMALCTGSCFSFWRPLTVSGTPRATGVTGKLAVVKRPDGGRQVTFNGKLLYSFTLDKPGKVTGNGFKDAFGGYHFTWHVAHPTKSVVSSGGTTVTGPSGY